MRPAFADNVPKTWCAAAPFTSDGMYRHGFLLAPVLAELVAEYLSTGALDERVFQVETAV